MTTQKKIDKITEYILSLDYTKFIPLGGVKLKGGKVDYYSYEEPDQYLCIGNDNKISIADFPSGNPCLYVDSIWINYSQKYQKEAAYMLALIKGLANRK